MDEETHRREVERKERLKKLKAKTSKMRLAEVKQPKMTAEQQKKYDSVIKGVKTRNEAELKRRKTIKKNNPDLEFK